jgi:spore coat protein CotH
MAIFTKLLMTFYLPPTRLNIVGPFLSQFLERGTSTLPTFRAFGPFLFQTEGALYARKLEEKRKSVLMVISGSTGQCAELRQRRRQARRKLQWSATFALSLSLLLLTLSIASANAAAPAAPAQVAQNSAAGDDLFTNASVPKLRLEIPASGIAALHRDPVNSTRTANSLRTNVLGTVREGTAIYTNVSISFRGALGSFRPIDQYPELILDFDKFAPGQRFHGLQKISLYNSVQDPTCLTEQLCRELFAAAGVPVPRATHVQVELNGSDLWIYVLVEGWNEQFLSRYLKNTKGNLYVGYFTRDITEDLATECGENPQDRSGLKALAAAVNEPNPTNRLARLEKVLDLDRFISMIAMEVLLCHWDGYAMLKNNYRAYHDPDSNRLVFMPDGMDQMFGTGGTSPTLPITPPRITGLVASAVLETVEGRRRYLQRIAELYTNVFKVEALPNRVNTLASKIRPLFAERNPQGAEFHERAVAALIERIVQRGRSLDDQLSFRSRPLRFDATGVARLPDWKPKTILGTPDFELMNGAGRKPLFRISADQGSCVGSWRTSVALERGRYRIEGRVKTQAVVPDRGDPRGGVGLRTAKTRVAQTLSGDRDWTPVAHEFDVVESVADVELVCELRARKGQAWFYLESLKLVRQ